MNIVELNSISFAYNGRKVFERLNLAVQRGEFVALAGQNGCGKSTLLRVLSGLVRPNSGCVKIEGQAAESLSPLALSQKVAYLPQFPTFPPGYTVIAAVMQASSGLGSFFDSSQAVNTAKTALEMADCLHLASRDLTTLSGGEFRRVAFARAIAQNAPIMILDEPAASLDLRSGAAMFALLTRLSANGSTVIAATHDINLALAYASRIVMIAGGDIVSDGAPETAVTKESLLKVFGVECEILKPTGSSRPAVVPIFYD